MSLITNEAAHKSTRGNHASGQNVSLFGFPQFWMCSARSNYIFQCQKRLHLCIQTLTCYSPAFPSFNHLTAISQEATECKG